MLSEYNSVRARIQNSQRLLEGTNLMLYTINQTTLVRWYKDITRRNEIKFLMQGLSLPRPSLTTDSDSLPPAKVLPTRPHLSPINPHSFPEAEDTTGQARVRGSTSTPSLLGPSDEPIAIPLSTTGPSTSTSTSPCVSGPPPPVSRTTEWRHKKTGCGQAARSYKCKVCKQPMTTEGHTQFRGQRYCPKLPGQIPREEWIAQKKAEADAKKAAQEDRQ